MTLLKINRRRFMTISAGALAGSIVGSSAIAGRTQPVGTAGRVVRTWALGNEVSIILAGIDDGQFFRISRRIKRELAGVESEFSLFAPSSLKRLNQTGILRHPGGHMLELFDLSNRLNQASHGAFDPTVQGYWQVLASGEEPDWATIHTGWDAVNFNEDKITIPPNMALTFNGIAQGHASDRIAALLKSEGLDNILVDAGEICAVGKDPDDRDWQVMIADPNAKPLKQLTLKDRALATSSPASMLVGQSGKPHIMHPDGRQPLWNTVSVSADSAALADGLSTAFCLMSREQIDRALAHFSDARLEICV